MNSGYNNNINVVLIIDYAKIVNTIEYYFTTQTSSTLWCIAYEYQPIHILCTYYISYLIYITVKYIVYFTSKMIFTYLFLVLSLLIWFAAKKNNEISHINCMHWWNTQKSNIIEHLIWCACKCRGRHNLYCLKWIQRAC